MVQIWLLRWKRARSSFDSNCLQPVHRTELLRESRPSLKKIFELFVPRRGREIQISTLTINRLATMNLSAIQSVQQDFQRLGITLFEVRLRKSLTQRDLAVQAGVSLSTVRRLERGESGVAIHALFATFKVLDLLGDINSLVGSVANIASETATNGRSSKRVRKSKHAGSKASLTCHLPAAQASPVPAGGCNPASSDELDPTIVEQSLPMTVQEVQEHRQADVSGAEPSNPGTEIRHLVAEPSKNIQTSSRQARLNFKAGSWIDVATAIDAEPSGFALKVIQRARERGQAFPELRGFNAGSADNLSAVLDMCRIGASRARPYSASSPDVQKQKWLLPHHFDLEAIGNAIAAFERREEKEHQLKLLMHCATALGGSQPKCTYLHEKQLWVAKFPSVFDALPLNFVELRTMHFAWAGGIQVLDVKFVHPISAPYLLSARYDRSAEGGRLRLVSAQSVLMAMGEEEGDHLQLLAAMRSLCSDFEADAQQLWRRLMFYQQMDITSAGLSKVRFVEGAKDRWNLVAAHGLRSAFAQSDAPAFHTVAPLPESLALEKLMQDSHAFGISRADAVHIAKVQLSALKAFSVQPKRWPFS